MDPDQCSLVGKLTAQQSPLHHGNAINCNATLVLSCSHKIDILCKCIPYKFHYNQDCQQLGGVAMLVEDW